LPLNKYYILCVCVCVCVCVFVALDIQHAMHMCCIVICSLRFYCIFPLYPTKGM